MLPSDSRRAWTFSTMFRSHTSQQQYKECNCLNASPNVVPQKSFTQKYSVLIIEKLTDGWRQPAILTNLWRKGTEQVFFYYNFARLDCWKLYSLCLRYLIFYLVYFSVLRLLSLVLVIQELILFLTVQEY